MPDLKSMIKDLTIKTIKTQEVDKTAAEKIARTIAAAKATAKNQQVKKA